MCTSNTVHMNVKSELITGNIAVMKTDSSLFACSSLMMFFSCNISTTFIWLIFIHSVWLTSDISVLFLALHVHLQAENMTNSSTTLDRLEASEKGVKESQRKEIKINASTSAEKAIQSIDEIYLFEHRNVNAFFVLEPLPSPHVHSLSIL